MTLGDAYIEAALGHLTHHYVHRAARGHGGGDTHDALILACKVEERLTKDILIAVGGVCRLGALTCFKVKTPWGVPYRGVCLGRSVTLALYGLDMQ